MKGRPFPDWYLDCPNLFQFEFGYIKAFWDLSSERINSAQTLGRIPWSKARQYGREVLNFEGSTLDHFWTIITELDNGFLKWQKTEHDNHVRRNKPAHTSGPTSTRRTHKR